MYTYVDIVYVYVIYIYCIYYTIYVSVYGNQMEHPMTNADHLQGLHCGQEDKTSWRLFQSYWILFRNVIVLKKTFQHVARW